MAKDGPTKRRLHRVDVVASQQQMSKRSIARNSGLSVSEVEMMLDPSINLAIRQLRAIQQALGEVPLADLVVKPAARSAEDHDPTTRRAILVKLKKTAGALFEELAPKGDRRRAKEHALRFIDLLVQFAPELKSELEAEAEPSEEDEFDDLCPEETDLSALEELGDRDDEYSEDEL